MTIEMYQDVMNHLQIDKYRELIIKQDQKITELEKACEETQELLDKQIEATYRLDKENAELKEKLNFSTQYYKGEKAQDQLTKAKEIIREFVEWANWQGNSKCPSFKDIQDKAEQFLSEVEK